METLQRRPPSAPVVLHVRCFQGLHDALGRQTAVHRAQQGQVQGLGQCPGDPRKTGGITQENKGNKGNCLISSNKNKVNQGYLREKMR